MLKTFTLKNGIKVATYNLPQLKSVHLRLAVKGGMVVEEKKKEGVAHFMEHILVQGIPSLPNVELFSSFIEGLAGSYNAYTEELLVEFGMTVPSTHLEDVVRVGKEVFFEPLFAEDAIDRERRAVISELEQKMDSHWYKITKFFRDVRFNKLSPLIIDMAQEVETSKELIRQDLIDYWQKYFLPKNSYLIVTGNFQDAKLKDLLSQYFKNIKSAKFFAGYPKMSSKDLSKRQVSIRFDSTLQTIYLDFSYPSLRIEEDLKLRVEQNILLTLLGRIRNSRLVKLLRYQRGLVYSISSGARSYPGLGYVVISSEVSPSHLDEVIELTVKEVKNFITDGPTEKELVFIKHFFTNQWLMSFDHPSNIAGWLENDLLWCDKTRLPEEYVDIIKDLSLKELTLLMQKYWDFGKLNLTLQGPIEDSAENVKKYTQMLEDLK